MEDISVNALVAGFMANNFGYVMADVAMDSLSIEYAQRETLADRGGLQGHTQTKKRSQTHDHLTSNFTSHTFRVACKCFISM